MYLLQKFIGEKQTAADSVDFHGENDDQPKDLRAGFARLQEPSFFSGCKTFICHTIWTVDVPILWRYSYFSSLIRYTLHFLLHHYMSILSGDIHLQCPFLLPSKGTWQPPLRGRDDLQFRAGTTSSLQPLEPVLSDLFGKVSNSWGLILFLHEFKRKIYGQ